MLKRPENVSEQSADEPVIRRGNKFSELGTRMERIFRAAFRKDNLSQSKQQLHPDIEETQDNYPSSPVNVIKNPVKTLSARTEAIASSDWTSDGDYGSRTNLVQSKLNLRDNFHGTNDDIIDNSKIENLDTRKVRKLKKFPHVKSKDLESNSLDVIVDIHRENSNIQSPRNIPETVVNISSDDLEIEEQILVPEINQKSLISSLDNSMDSMKRQRKRWSKETNVILPPKPNSSSSPSVSDKSSRWGDTEVISKPIPAPRSNKIVHIEEKNNLGRENKAFVSDNDEQDQVLRIETNYGVEKRTKIEIKSIKSAFDESLDIQHLPVTEQRLSEQFDDSVDEEITAKRRITRDKKRISSDNSSGTSKNSKSSSSKTVKIRKSTKRISSNDISTVGDSTSSAADIQVIKTDQKDKIERKRRSMSSNRDSGTSAGSKTRQNSTKMTKTKKSKSKTREVHENKFISVKIHRADMLVPEYITRHPMVIVHIVEESTGNYLKDPDPAKPKANYLQPLITGTYDFKENKSMIPCWDEELIFEHDFNALKIPGNNQVLILFEIVDLPSFADASYVYDQFGGGHCWYKIAWAFLKPHSSSGTSHMDKPVRLQLYKPKKSLHKTQKARCESYSWWKRGSRDKYPSTLFVTVTSVEPPKLEPIFYGHLTLDDPVEAQEMEKTVANNLPEPGNISRWGRLAAQSCKIPNELFFKTEINENGCFYSIFSNNGHYLACANCEEYDYPITIYKIDEGKIILQFSGHQSFIYALDWSNNDEILLSVSSDQTARIWDVKNKIVQEIYMLPHPSYVYCGKFQPNNPQIIITGCYDHTTRLWSRGTTSNNYELIQELEGHEGFVNSICFLKDGDLLTADSVGVIIQWMLKKKRGRSSRDWQITRKIKIREIVNIPINTIVLHPLGSRLLVHSRDNGLRMLDLATGVVLQRYLGLKNLRIQTAAKISPCGGLLLCGGEDATLNIWSLESGKHIARYQTNLSSPIACVDYHPYDHVLVYSMFGIPTETIILKFDKQSSGQSVGLQLLDEPHNEFGIEQIKSIETSSRSGRRRTQLNDHEESLENPLNNEREDLRSRLKMFNTSEGLLKTKSANRLTGIIAKIDRILSNSGTASKSTYDIEANRIETLHERVFPREQLHPTIPYVPPLFSTFEDTSGSKSELIELIDLREDKTRSKRRKPKSAQHRKTSGRHDEPHKTLSDGAITSRNKSFANGGRIFESSPWTTTNTIGDFKNSEIACSYREKRDDNSSADSAGTYVVDKSDGGKFESESSIRSDVTFVIESERPKPVPKPRKKRSARN